MSEEISDDDWRLRSAFEGLPPVKEFWAQKSDRPLGEDEPHDLWRAIGQALSAYEWIEEEQADLFSFFVESKSPASKRAYGICVGGRKDMLTEAGMVFLNRRNAYLDDLDGFKIVMQHHSAASAIRNCFAHGTVRKLRSEGDTEGKWFLISPSYNSRKVSLESGQTFYTYKIEELGSKFIFSSQEILNFEEKFLALRKAIHYFSMRLMQTYEHDVYTGQKFPQIFSRKRETRIND